MGGQLAGRVALVTGVARGQGRSHALRLAAEGAAIIGVDICADINTVAYPMATADDLAQTRSQLDDLGAKSLLRIADVRSLEAMTEAVTEGEAALGRIEVVVANAGICTLGTTWELSAQEWQDVIDVNLTGVFNTVRAVVPTMVDSGCKGSIVLTSSICGVKGVAHLGHYCASKHGVMGLMAALANELGPHGIRVNCINPSNVDTAMLANDAVYESFRPDLDRPQKSDAAAVMIAMHPLQIPWVDVADVSEAVAWLASDASRFVTGTALKIDAGASVV